MSDTEKRSPTPQPSKPEPLSVPFRESHDDRAIHNRQDVSNTRPAPPNPHRDEGGDKESKP